MLYAAGERRYGAVRALRALEEYLAQQPAAENVELLAAAIAGARLNGNGDRRDLPTERLYAARMSKPESLRGAVAELIDVLRAKTEAADRVMARLELVDTFDAMPPDRAAWLATTAVEMLEESSSPHQLDEQLPEGQLYVLKLREYLEHAEKRIGTNAAVNAMARELAKKPREELACALALAVHLIIHP